jgi:lipoate-protein ligase A
MKLQFIVSDQTNPYWNIAVENYLLSLPETERITLYLWKNHRTVVIGQNQNPFSECNVEALEADGGYLMRRKTGGGAVYHDDGNINFSFVVPKAMYDQTRQFRVIQRAVASFGIEAELSGRNDILTEGRKFSGNAFSKGKYQDLHHGTILIKGNMEDLQRYLKPKPAKLQKHGVASVQSRVVNLSELNPAITSESIVPHLRKAFESEYAEYSEYSDYSEIIKRPEVRSLYEEFASDEWKYGRWKTFTAQRSGQFEWGGVELSLTVDQERGIVTDVLLASDALDLAALDEARRLLVGASTARAPQTDNPILKDIFSLIYS